MTSSDKTNGGSSGRFFEEVSVGEELTALHKQIDLPHMMAYGAATWDFIRVHYDADYVRELGFSGPFVDGQMLGAFLAQQVQDWAGRRAFLRKLSFRNRVMAYPGDSLLCGGVVTGLRIEGEDQERRGLAESAICGSRISVASAWSNRPAPLCSFHSGQVPGGPVERRRKPRSTHAVGSFRGEGR